MTQSGLGLTVKKPVAVWNRPLKANFKDLFKALGKSIIDSTTGNWTGVASDVLDATIAVGLGNDSGQIAWLLIYRSINRAIADLVTDSQPLMVKQPPDFNDFCDHLDLSLEDLELTIDQQFFDRPRSFPLLSAIAIPLAQWFGGFVETPSQATAIAQRLPSYFVLALHQEWRQRSTDYACLKPIETPFTRAAGEEQAWREYASWLQKQIEEPLLGVAAFGLQQVYVPLRAYYEQESDTPSPASSYGWKTSQQPPERIVVDLHTQLEQWLTQANKDDAIRVISGGPGSGKSSFTKLVAATQSEQPHRRVFYVPLHQIDPSKDLVAAIKDLTVNHPCIRFNPLEFPGSVDRLLLILDGLDELSMQGKVGATVAQSLIHEVQRQVDRLNYTSLRLQVLLSGRELTVQANRTDLRKPGQVLHLLPYVVSEDEQKQYTDTKHRLAADQRQTWWQKYGAVTGQTDQRLPAVLNHGKLRELTAQPLLNYLIAMSYEQGALTVAATTNLNTIYCHLLTKVYQRGWERHDHPALRGVDEKGFVRILEEVAVATWHGDGRTTTILAIEAQCTSNRLQPLLAAFQEGAKLGVMRLLTAFYFRQQGLRGNEPTVEFTHKSFGEYLTARRIVRAIGLMHDQLMDRQQNPDRGWDERQALAHWATICGPTRMDPYLFEFVCDEVRLLHEDCLFNRKQSPLPAWQQTLSYLIEVMLRHGMPMEKLEPRPTFHEENRQAINAEEALLAALNACARCTHTVSQILWEGPETFGTWFAASRDSDRTEKFLFTSV